MEMTYVDRINKYFGFLLWILDMWTYKIILYYYQGTLHYIHIYKLCNTTLVHMTYMCSTHSAGLRMSVIFTAKSFRQGR